MNRKKMGLMAGIGLLMAAAAVPGTALADTVYVTAGNLNCREGKSTDSAVLGTVPRGTKIQRESDDGTWSRVTVNGKACYAASRYLSSQEPAGNRETAVPWMESQTYRSTKKMYTWKAQRTCSWTKTGNLLHFPR